MSNGRRPAGLTSAELWSIFAAALAVRWLTAQLHGFDGAYGQDAWGYVDRAQRWLDSGFALQPLHPRYTMPTGHPHLIALGSLVTGSLVSAAQWLSLLTGAATAVLCAAITRLAAPEAPRTAAWIAAGLVSLSGQHVTWSIAAMSDVPAAFGASASALALLQAAREQHSARQALWMAAAGMGLGVAWSIRWSWVAVAPAYGAFWLWLLARRRVTVSAGIAAAIAGALTCLPQLIVTLRHPAGLGVRWSGDWRPWNVFESSFYFAEGAYDYALPMGAYYLLPAVHPGWLTPIGGLAAVAGAAWMYRTNEPVARVAALSLLLGSAGTNWLMLSGMPHQNFRYGMQIWLFLTPLAGIGAANALGASQRRALTRSLGALGAAALLMWTVRAPIQLIDKVVGHREAGLALVAPLPANAVIYALGPTAELSHRTDRDVKELFESRPDGVARDLASGRPVYALFDPAAVARWKVGPVPETVGWMKRNATWKERGKHSPWTLWHLTPMPQVRKSPK